MGREPCPCSENSSLPGNGVRGFEGAYPIRSESQGFTYGRMNCKDYVNDLLTSVLLLGTIHSHNLQKECPDGYFPGQLARAKGGSDVGFSGVWVCLWGRFRLGGFEPDSCTQPLLSPTPTGPSALLEAE